MEKKNNGGHNGNRMSRFAMRRNTVYDRRAHGALGALHLHKWLA
jgi:hypothetical protein